MALAILEKPTEDTPLQIPLPAPESIPAWVHAALDRWDTSHATYIGLQVTNAQYPELADVSDMNRKVERAAYSRLRRLATLWQFANYRTFLTSFEMWIMKLELEALEKPYALKRYTHEHVVRDKDGSFYRVTQDTWNHDVNWIAEYIQKRVGAGGYAMGVQQIKYTLKAISHILEVCDELEIHVGHIDNMRQWHHSRI